MDGQTASQVAITRVFDAPREQVFRAFIEPERIPRWWGPASLKTRVEKMEVTPGRRWRFVQTDPEGAEYGFHGMYHDITTTRIIQTFEYEGMARHVSLETILFEPLEGNRTRVIDQTVFQSVEDRDGMLASGMEPGAVELFDRLEKLLRESQ